MNCGNAFVSTNVQNIRSIQPCVRWGCTDFLPDSQYAYFFEIVGDVARIVLFYFLSLEPEETAKMPQVEGAVLHKRPEESAVSMQNLRNRKPLSNTAIKF